MDILEVVHNAGIDKSQVEKRTKFIKDQLDKMSEDQLTRFEFFVRSHLPRSKVKEIICDTLGVKQSSKEITDEMTIVVSSLAKLFCGELMETATEVLKEDTSSGSVDVQHITEAVRRMQREGRMGDTQEGFFMFDSTKDIFRESSCESMVKDITKVPEIMDLDDDDDD